MINLQPRHDSRVLYARSYTVSIFCLLPRGCHHKRKRRKTEKEEFCAPVVRESYSISLYLTRRFLIPSTMTNDNAMNESTEAFLKRLGLPSHHPFVEETSESESSFFHEGRGHNEWSVMDYFKPQGTKPLPTTCNTSIGKQNPQNHWKSFSIFANDCPAQLDACFCSDEKASDNTLADCFRIHLVWAKDKIGAANIILSQFNETYNQIWPSLRASFHLTLRLFAPLILTLAVIWHYTGHNATHHDG